MNPILAVFFMASAWVNAPKPFDVQFGKSEVGQTVEICLDGQKVEQTFAGKMSFQDESHAWQSVCADVRSPVHEGQIFKVKALSSKKFGGNIAKAGNIVAKCFKLAESADQCAGLQIAVWKAIEDGTDEPDFRAGHFQVIASEAVLAYAKQYYQASSIPGDAVYLQANLSEVGALPQSQMSTQ